MRDIFEDPDIVGQTEYLAIHEAGRYSGDGHRQP